MTGFSLMWYKQLFESQMIMEALLNTLVIAFLSSLIATILGTLACIGINQMKKVPKTIVMGLNNIPLLNAEIVTGISLMLIFIAFGVTLGFKTILIGHITFNVPYVILSVMPKLKQTEKSTYEAALDLGATPVYAFFKTIFPDILPGILSGFLLSFTMSLDDFVITHFVKGAGINTLSTLIYSEVRKGIRPSLYALSSIMFVAVFLLLLVINRPKKERPVKVQPKKVRIVKQVVPVLLVLFLLTGIIASAFRKDSAPNGQLMVYNWGEYIDESVITQFEEEYGIDVIYDTFETNEEMYPIIEAGGVSYDVICPSDYMIEKMISNDLLQEIDFNNIPNAKYLNDVIMEGSKAFDPENKYSVPYTYGTLGILYNTALVKEPADSWEILWDEDYKGEILMYNSVRDLFAAPLKLLGYSLNTTDETELTAAKELLIAQKPLVQKSVMDQVKDLMVSDSAALAMCYSGEVLVQQEQNENLQYVVPKEGSNFFIDAWVIPKNAENKENAEKWLDFLNRPDIAYKNFEYITYSTPNDGAVEMMDDELKNNPAVFPGDEILANCEVFKALGAEGDRRINDMWLEVKDK